MRLLGWVRDRHQEIRMAIEQVGGVAGILKKISDVMDHENDGPNWAPSVQPLPPRKKRTSLGYDRRRSDKKLDANAAINIEVAKKTEAKAREPGVGIEQTLFQSQAKVREPEQAPLNSPPREEEDIWSPPLDGSSPEPVNERRVSKETTERLPETPQPPRSTYEVFQMLKNSKETEKKNHGIFARQANAQRMEFGDPLSESQSIPGLSSSSNRTQKRSRPDDDDDEEDELFEWAPRTTNLQSRRADTKRVRIEPSSSDAPPSHQIKSSSSGVPSSRQRIWINLISSCVSPSYQPAQIDDDVEYRPDGDIDVLPPPTFQKQRRLAYENRNTPPIPVQRQRKARTAWSYQEEDALIEYMAEYPRMYARILLEDDKNDKILQNRTQVNLKDKARSMAVVMVKYVVLYDRRGLQANVDRSRTGLRPGFQDVITPAMARGLREAGYMC